MKHFSLLIFSALLLGCNDHDLSSLNQEKVRFNDLPIEIIQYLNNPTDFQNDIQSMLLELPKGKEKNYTLETVNTWIGPWVSHGKLVDIKKNIYYEIDQGTPSPYIIYENRLYIPDSYNIFTNEDDLSSLKFTVYELK